MSLIAPGVAAAVGRMLQPPPPEAETLLRTGDGLAAFAARIGQPLAPHQADSLALRKRITAIVAPRQAGKSRGVSVLALERSVAEPNHHTLIVSAGEAAAKRVLALIRHMALQADPRGAQLAAEPTHELLTFTNGSTIRCVPTSERRIRGWTIDLLILDEAAMIDDQVILGAAIPTTNARPLARIVVVSSALLAAGTFYNFVTDGENGAAHIDSFRWSLEDSPWISQATIDTARQALSPQQFAAEYLGEFPESGAGLLIPRSWIRAAQERDLPGTERGAFGVDVARSGTDFTTIYRNRGGVVREIRRVNGQTTMETAGQVAQLMRHIPAVPAVVDVVGVGAGVVDRLAELELRVVAFNAGSKARRPDVYANRRAEVFWQLRQAFETGRIDIDPKDTELADELASLRYSTNSKGKTIMEGKDSIRARGLPSPDRCDAIVMCVCAAPMDMTEDNSYEANVARRFTAPRTPDAVRVKPGEGAGLRRRPM